MSALSVRDKGVRCFDAISDVPERLRVAEALPLLFAALADLAVGLPEFEAPPVRFPALFVADGTFSAVVFRFIFVPRETSELLIAFFEGAFVFLAEDLRFPLCTLFALEAAAFFALELVFGPVAPLFFVAVEPFFSPDDERDAVLFTAAAVLVVAAFVFFAVDCFPVEVFLDPLPDADAPLDFAVCFFEAVPLLVFGVETPVVLFFPEIDFC